MAQLVVIPLGAILFAVFGVWLWSTGNTASAWWAFGIAAAGPLSVGAYYLLARVAGRRVIRGAASLSVDRLTALEWAKDALTTLAPDEVVHADPETLSAFIDTPRTWKSFGERIVATVQDDDADRTLVEVSSKSTPSQLIDYGKNHTNVDRVLHALMTRDRER